MTAPAAGEARAIQQGVLQRYLTHFKPAPRRGAGFRGANLFENPQKYILFLFNPSFYYKGRINWKYFSN